MIRIGEVVQNGLNALNPLKPVVIYKFDGQVLAADGSYSESYATYESRCRIQPNNDAMYNSNWKSERESPSRIEITKVYKNFYFLSNSLSEMNRSLNTGGDYIKTTDNLYWRIVSVPEKYETGWIKVIAVQSDSIGG